MNGHQFLHLLGKVRDAAAGGKEAWSAQSTGEKVAVALALSRLDWLQSMGYTVPEAIDRAGPEWVSMIPQIEDHSQRPAVKMVSHESNRP